MVDKDKAREEAERYSQKISTDKRFLGTIFLGTEEYSRITDVVRKAYFDGFVKGQEDKVE